jgi:hypothetical protein
MPPLLYLLSRDAKNLLFIITFIITGIGLPLLVILWGVGNGNRNREGHEFAATNLPLWPINDWLASFLATLCTAALLGAWCGGWLVRTTPVFNGISIVRGAESVAVYFACCYAVSYFFSQSVAFFVGILCGVICAVSALKIFSKGMEYRTILITLWVVIGVSAGSLVYAWLSNKMSPQTRKAASFGIVIISVLAIFITSYLPMKQGEETSYQPLNEQSFSTPNMYFHITVSQKSLSKGNKAGSFNVLFEDQEHKQQQNRIFNVDRLCPVDLYGNRYIFFVEQQHKADHLELVRWDVTTNQVNNVISLPKVPLHCGFQISDLLLSSSASGGQIGHISPDGKYLILTLTSAVGGGNDLWIIDLQSKSARIVLPNRIFGADEATWTEDGAILTGSGNAVKVNFKKPSAEIININWERCK